MLKLLPIFSLLLFLSTPAFAQADSSCDAPTDATTDYVQRGDDIIMVECPASGEAACACHEPVGDSSTCKVYPCNADGSVKEPPKPKVAPKEEPKPTAEKPKAKGKTKKKPAATDDKVEYSRSPR